MDALQSTIRTIIDDSRLWNEGRDQSHGFILTPEVYHLDEAESGQLKNLGESLYEVMKGLNTLVAYSENQKIAKGKTWDMIRRIVRIGVPRPHRAVQAIRPDDYPVLFKVDLLRSKGNFWIVELDGVNTHGFGYTVLLSRIRDAIASGASYRLGGVANTVASNMQKNYHGRPLFCFIGGNSRFYEPYYRIFTEELKRLGIPAIFAGEWMPDHERLMPENAVVLQFPIFRGSSRLQDALVAGYQDGSIDFLVSPKTFMGSKSVLAMLMNSAQDQALADILRSFISPTELEIFRSYVPETYLIYPQGEPVLMPDLVGKSWILKRAISSGMKGVEFLADRTLSLAQFQREGNYQVTLQEEKENDPFILRSYDAEGDVFTDTWYLRFTAHFHFDRVAELDITARRDKLVHGAKDCLMFSAVLA